MSLTSHRQSRYTVTLLDGSDREVRPLGRVTGGRVALSSTTRLRASGQISLLDDGSDIDWSAHRVRIDYAGGGRSWPIGVFLPSAPTVAYTAVGRGWDVELVSKLALLDADVTESAYTAATGTPVTTLLGSLIQSVTGERASITPSPASLSAALTWEPGTPWLTVINDLLSAINYFSLTTTGAGVFTASPYVPPARRGTAWEFSEGEAAIHSPQWTRDQDIAGVPNKVVLVAQGESDTPALVGVALNEDPTSPFSYPSRGRWVSLVETDVDAANQASITALAQRRLIDASSPQATIKAAFAPLPLAPNDSVAWDTAGHHARAVVRSLEYTLDPTALCSADLVEVVDL